MCAARAPRARYFSNVFNCKGVALTHLPKCPLGRDNPWVQHAGLSLEGGIFKQQQTTLVWHLVLRDLALKAWAV